MPGCTMIYGNGNTEEVKAAEERMNAAKAALLDYAERPATQGRDADLQHRLSEELTRSTKELLSPARTMNRGGALATMAHRDGIFHGVPYVLVSCH